MNDFSGDLAGRIGGGSHQINPKEAELIAAHLSRYSSEILVDPVIAPTPH